MFCAGLCCAAVLTVGAAVPASAAPNLVTNGGFETWGSNRLVFSDTFPDLTAWTTTLGAYTGPTGGAITSRGNPGTTDIVTVASSQDTADVSLQVTETPVVVQPQMDAGPIVRYQNANNFYGCALTKGSLLAWKRLSGTDTTLSSTAFTSVANTAYKVTAAVVGSTLTCSAVPAAGGTAATVSATDSSFASGQFGLFAKNENGGPIRQTRFSAPIASGPVPSGWSALNATAGRPGLVPDQVAAANAGSRSLQVFSNSPLWSGNSEQTVAVVANSPYTLQAAISTSAVVGLAEVVAVEQPSGHTTVLGPVLGTTGWTLFSNSFTTQPTTTSVIIRPLIQGSGRANFDDISLTGASTVDLQLSSSGVDFGPVDPITATYTLTSAETATVTANADWVLATSGSGDFADGTGESFPLAQLAWHPNGSAAAYTAFTTAAATVTTGTATPATGTAVPVDLRLQVTYADPPSSQPFQTTLTYIATTP